MLAAAANGAALYMSVTPDSHFVVLDRTGKTLWKSTNVMLYDSAVVAATAWNARQLQGKDTTALFNAKTLQGKDTLAVLRVTPDTGTYFGASRADIVIGKKNGVFAIQGDSGSTAILQSGVYGGWYTGNRFRGTLASPSVVQSGDQIATLQGKAYNGSGLASAAAIRYYVDSSFASGGYVPSRISFYTGGDSATYTEKMRLDRRGKLMLDTTGARGAAVLTVKGNANADSFVGPLVGNASSASLLQTKDTTALWNAKTVQGKDTTALFAAKTATKIATNGDSAKVWGMTSPSTQGWITGGSATTNADSLGHKAAVKYQVISDTQTLAVSSGRTAFNVSLGSRATVTMTSNDTMSKPTGLVNGQLVTLAVRQDSTGSRRMTWDYHFRFCGDTASTGYATAAPTLTATGWGGDLFTFLVSNDSFLYFQNFSPAVFRAYKP